VRAARAGTVPGFCSHVKTLASAQLAAVPGTGARQNRCKLVRASGVAGKGIIVDGASAAWKDERDTATRRRPLAQWLAVLAILCAGCGGGATGDTGKPAAARERRPDQVLALRVGDPAYIIDAINEAAPHDARVDDAVLGLLRKVWAANSQKFPRLAWTVLALPEVRMAVADPLVLARRSHRIEIDTAEMRALEAQYDLAHGNHRQLIHSIISARQRMLTNRCDDRV
jgi:hypothetical protein